MLFLLGRANDSVDAMPVFESGKAPQVQQSIAWSTLLRAGWLLLFTRYVLLVVWMCRLMHPFYDQLWLLWYAGSQRVES